MTADPPLIGITAYVEQARWGVWDTRATLLPHCYVQQVQDAGGRAVVLPPAVEGADRLLAALDGLLLAGGADIEPALYHESPHPQTGGVRPDRDTGELALLRAALHRDLPVLGVCRGMQLLCVAHGGTLAQHLPETLGHTGHRPAPGVYGEHAVRTAPGSVLAATIGERATVACYHHQGVLNSGSLTVSAHADDESIEAVELPGARFALGVLWHPEVGDDPRLFEALTAAAATHCP